MKNGTSRSNGIANGVSIANTIDFEFIYISARVSMRIARLRSLPPSINDHFCNSIHTVFEWDMIPLFSYLHVFISRDEITDLGRYSRNKKKLKITILVTKNETTTFDSVFFLFFLCFC